MSQAQASQQALPEYQLLQKAFFEPELLEPGTIVIFEGLPGPHLLPLNDAAKAKMEEFYSFEREEVDSKTRQPTGKMERPREKLRLTQSNPAPFTPATVVARPAQVNALEVQSLAEIAAARKSTDQRPGPAPIPKTEPVVIPAKEAAK